MSRLLKFSAYGALAVGAVVILLGGILGWVAIPKIIENKVKDETRLIKDSDTYDKWEKLPVPIYLKVWFFNITNYYELSQNWAAKPQMKEIGPFVWKETRIKYDIQEFEQQDIISYRQNISYVFDKELSCKTCREDSLLTVVNIPFIGVITLLDVHPILRPFGNLVLSNLVNDPEIPQTLFMNTTAVDIVFKGHNLTKTYKTVENFARALKIPLPDEFQNGQFAAYRGRNNTNADKKWEVYRGVKDPSKFSIIRSVNDGKTSLEPWWYDKYSNMVNGTDGTMFPPFIEKSTRLYVYAGEICRSIFLDFKEEVEFEGIKGYRFILPKEMFTSPYDYPPNQGFCMPVSLPLNDSCNFNGMGRLFSCKEQIPIAISKPHFLDADEWVITQARSFGMSPRREDHDTYLDLEPNTGFPLRVHKRLQIGVELQPYKSAKISVGQFENIPHIIYPLFWVDEQAELDDELIEEIKTKLVRPLNAVTIGKWTAIGVGSALFIGGLVATVFLWKRSS